MFKFAVSVLLLTTEGQKIAMKLASQVAKLIRSLLEDYSACLPVPESPEDSISVAEALDPPTIEGRLQSLGTWQGVVNGERREVMDAYLTVCRCREELVMLKEEAQNTVNAIMKAEKMC